MDYIPLIERYERRIQAAKLYKVLIAIAIACAVSVALVANIAGRREAIETCTQRGYSMEYCNI